MDSNLSILSITDDAQSSSLLDTEANVSGARLSPNGRWLAYTANPFGGAELYVQPFPGLEGRYLVSTDGGSEPLWRGDGKELFYLDSKNNLVAVAVETEPAFRVVASRTLFNPPRIFGFTNRYVTTRDGQRFFS
jgi:Tol biopolymer transport system component